MLFQLMLLPTRIACQTRHLACHHVITPHLALCWHITKRLLLISHSLIAQNKIASHRDRSAATTTSFQNQPCCLDKPLVLPTPTGNPYTCYNPSLTCNPLLSNSPDMFFNQLDTHSSIPSISNTTFLSSPTCSTANGDVHSSGFSDHSTTSCLDKPSINTIRFDLPPTREDPFPSHHVFSRASSTAPSLSFTHLTRTILCLFFYVTIILFGLNHLSVFCSTLLHVVFCFLFVLIHMSFEPSPGLLQRLSDFTRTFLWYSNYLYSTISSLFFKFINFILYSFWYNTTLSPVSFQQETRSLLIKGSIATKQFQVSSGLRSQFNVHSPPST